MNRCFRVLSILLVFFLVGAEQQVCGEDRFDGLDAYVQEGMETWKVPGLALTIVKDGTVTVSRSYGTRQLGQDAPVTPETIFPIASCTKSFTASCIAMLVDEGKVQWDDPVRQHLPDFKVADRM